MAPNSKIFAEVVQALKQTDYWSKEDRYSKLLDLLQDAESGDILVLISFLTLRATRHVAELERLAELERKNYVGKRKEEKGSRETG